MTLIQVGDRWVDPPAFAACPSCGADWRPGSRFMRSYMPCPCAADANGHALYRCNACEQTAYDPPHDPAIVLTATTQKAAPPPPVGGTGDSGAGPKDRVRFE